MTDALQSLLGMTVVTALAPIVVALLPGRIPQVVALILGLMATMLATMRGDPPSWLHTAWSLVLIAGVVLQGAALARLRALPHPWLQN